MEYKTNDILINSHYFHLRQPVKTISDQVYCLIHGWSGNEKSMTVFSSAVPEDATIIFPRGSLHLGQNSYAWADIRNNLNPVFEDYANISSSLMSSIQELIRSTQISANPVKYHLMGFSQGAAISAVLSILYPEIINKVALLSGFLPAEPPVLEQNTLAHINYYIAHGTKDKLVEFEKSLKLKDYLEKYGAETKFCQEDLGHKIGASCLRNLKLFFET